MKTTRIFLFLDFDGTLAQITGHPKDARLPPHLKPLLTQLATSPAFKVAIISGRSLPDLKKRIGVKPLIYAGNHGFEIDTGKQTFMYPAAKPFRKEMKQFAKVLKPLTRSRGVILEEKGFSLSLHYRMATRKVATQTKQTVKTIFATWPGRNTLVLRPAKQCIEIRPRLAWDKGKAVLWLLERFAKRTPFLPIYIGDDTTDEDAFWVLKKTSPRGICIRVGRKKRSHATHTLPNPEAVGTFLKELATGRGKK